MTTQDIALNDKGLTVTVGEQKAYFNYFWLRDNCSSTIDEATNEKVFDITATAIDPVAKTAVIENNDLVIRWRDESQVSRFALPWLLSWAQREGPADPAQLSRRLWGNNHYAKFVRLTQAEIEESNTGKLAFARALVEDGVALVTNMENSDEGLERLANHFSNVTPTVDGRFFDVRLHIEPTNLAFTAAELELHTDLPSEDAAPGVQFLHCRINTVVGGQSIFADGACVANALRAERPDDFELLSKYKVPFFRKNATADYRANQRVIELDMDGAVSGVTISQHLLDVVALPQNLLDSYYPALCSFIRMLKEPRFVNRFRLSAGECIVFDNHRIVHGREAFSASSGQRHLRGCYVTLGAVKSLYRVLA